MTRPGSTLRALARRVCDSPTMERLIDPVIADLQHEYAAAVGRAGAWRRGWIRLAGYCAFWKVVSLGALSIDTVLRRAMAMALSTGMVVTVLCIWMVLGNSPLEIVDGGTAARLILYLVPQALTISVPVCLAVGLYCRLRGRSASAVVRQNVIVLALGCTLATFANVGWIAPAANQAFRVVVSGGPAVRGPNELTFSELRRQRHDAIPGAVPEQQLPMAFWFHARLALCAAPALLCIFAVASATGDERRRSTTIIVATLTMYVGCMVLFTESQVAELMRWLPAFVIAWIPNIIIAAASVTVAQAGTLRTRAAI